MSKQKKNLRLSPLWVALLATTTTLNLPRSVRGENVTPTPDNAAANAPTDAVKNPSEATTTQTNPPAQPSEAQPTTPTPEPTPSPSETPSVQPTPPPAAEPPPPKEPRVLVSEVRVTGADQELENLVYNTIRTRPGRPATRSQLQEDRNAIFATGFFASVDIVPEDTPLGVRVTFAVKPNPIFNKVEIDTVPATEKKEVLPPQVVEEIFSPQYGKILNLRELQNGIRQVNEWYSKNGYDLAQVIGSPRISDDGVVTLIIAEGVVENIKVRYFNKEDEPVPGKTREFIVTREMQLKPGDVFNRNTAQKDLQRVFGLGLFEDAKLSFSPGTDPSEVVVNVDVVEGNTGSLAAGAGISSTAGLFGTISYQEQNLGGNDQNLSVEFQGGERELLFDFNFTDPWIAGDPYRTSYNLNAFRRQTISLVYDGNNSSIRTLNGFDSPRIVRTGAGITFARPLAENVFTRPDWRLSASLFYQNVRIENADGQLSPLSAPLNGFDSQNLAFSPSGIDDLWTISFSAVQDTRNNPIQTTSGQVLRFGIEQSLPLGSGSITYNRIRGSYSYFIPVDFLKFDFLAQKPETIAFNVQAGTVFGDLPPYEAFILGGSNSIRGYADGDVGSGRSYIQATAEYRFPIIDAVAGALFFDYGSNIGSMGSVPGMPGVIRELPGWGYGYGIGVRIQSPVGPIRVDYGFNNEGDSRIHFGIGERF